MPRADVKLGFSCNNRCRFCVQGDKRHREVDLDTAAARRLLEEERAHCDDLVLTGGEATLRPDLVDLVAHARALGYRVIQLQTNGRALAVAGILEKLVEAGLTEVSPALHGATAETHDALTRAPGSFRQTAKGIRRARALGLPVIVNSVVTRANFRELPALAELLVALGASRFQFAFVHALGSAAADFDAVVPRFRDVMPFVRRGLAVGWRAGVPCTTEAIPLCLLEGIEQSAAEWTIPPTRIRDAGRLVADYTASRRTEGKAHGPACGSCRWVDRCEGPWKEYPERFGWEEFRPVRS